jgi:nucleoside-diphosphate-sugar epimerase
LHDHANAGTRGAAQHRLLDEEEVIDARQWASIRARQRVDGRSSDNSIILARLGWQPSTPLRDGIEKTYAWIYDQYVAREKRLRA